MKGGMQPSMTPVYILLVLILIVAGMPLFAPGVNLSEDPQLLYVQDAEGGTLTDNGDGTMTLSLTGVDDETVWFFDRPDRAAGDVDTQDFVDRWNEGGDSFAADPPNAAIRVHAADNSENTIVVELMNPSYNAATGTLTYDVEMVPKAEAAGNPFAAGVDNSIPETFEDVSLFIDSKGKVCAPEPICISWDV